MFIIILYLVIILADVLFVLSRKEATLVRGNTLFWFHAVFTGITLVLILALHFPFSKIFLLFLAVMFFLSYVFRNYWFLLKSEYSETAKIIENALQMILFKFEKITKGYIMKCGNSALILGLSNPLFSVTILTFSGERGVNRVKKVEVLKALLSKRFNKIIPRLVIHL